MLFGVVMVFIFGHSFRIIMDIQELIDITSVEDNPFAINDCNNNCASTFSLWSKVRTLEVQNRDSSKILISFYVYSDKTT